MGPRSFALQYLRENLKDIQIAEGYSVDIDADNIKEFITSEMRFELEHYPIIWLNPIGADLESLDEMSVVRNVGFVIAAAMRNATKEEMLELVDDIEQALTRLESQPSGFDSSTDFGVLSCAMVDENYEPEVFENDDKMRAVTLNFTVQIIYNPQTFASQ